MQVQTKPDDIVKIEWKAPYFPIIGEYKVFHIYEKNNIIIRVNKDEVFYQGNGQSSTKYTYLSKPLDSIDISLEIRNITLNDAGYYNSGSTLAQAQSGGGVVVIVYGTY